MPVHVLRLGHRSFRDKRISTHCGLVARALGAERMFYSGEKDKNLENSVNGVSVQWGGDFRMEYTENWIETMRNFKGKSVHLTMYGIPIQKRIKEIRRERNILVVIGGEKVPPEVYQISDWNIAVTNQPHSEVAALAIFLHEYFQGKELERIFKNPKRRIIPQERGKRVIEV
ncbi:MAG TPA: tRNA (cytidine(56)-2'-O)-methyltransferase [Candidatus Aenigmarchaeota archaeon]|nr:tRNA (cytidine(56)-2'-O)-methyltransferase [Candidatus Aenigmarchaeota archaeon]